MFRFLSLIVFALVLSGCDITRPGPMEPIDRINAAHPLPKPLQQAQQQLFAQVQLPVAAAALRQDYELRLQARALNCSAAAGSIDAGGGASSNLTSSECLSRQDAALLEWIGIQRVMLALRKPPAAPFAPLPRHTAIAGRHGPTVEVIAARAANVLVLKGAQGRLTTIELPAGRTLRNFTVPDIGPRRASLSPNGQVLAAPVGDGLRMIDVLSGDTLWSSARFSGVTAWLPEVDATLLSTTSGQAMLLDHRSGSVRPHPLQLPPLTWGLAAGGSKGRHVVGNGAAMFVIDHLRNRDGGISAALVRQRALPSQAATLPPMLMGNGRKLVFAGATDLGWLDIESGASGWWNLSAISARGFSKNSETTVYLDIDPPGVGGSGRLFDIHRATLMHVQGDAGADGTLTPLAARDGWIRIGRRVTVGGSAVAAGDAQPLGQVIADMQAAGRATPP